MKQKIKARDEITDTSRKSCEMKNPSQETRNVLFENDTCWWDAGNH